MSDVIRCFLVGCPRSGTTLLQSMLASHPEVYSLPETHYFSRLKAGNSMLSSLGMIERSAQYDFESKLAKLPPGDTQAPTGLKRFFIKNYAKSFADRLDNLTIAAKKSVWVEKTPQHLHRIDKISELMTSPRFIHIIRKGKDTIASLYEVTNSYPEQWGGARSLQQCIGRWTNDIGISHSFRFHRNHIIVSYENLVSAPDTELLRVCDFLDLDFVPDMSCRFQEAYDNVVKESGAEWTNNAGKPLRSRPSLFDAVFLDTEQTMVTSAVQQNQSTIDCLLLNGA